jgi:ketosteroid isomerase-like protein
VHSTARGDGRHDACPEGRGGIRRLRCPRLDVHRRCRVAPQPLTRAEHQGCALHLVCVLPSLHCADGKKASTATDSSPPLPGPHDGKEAVCGFNVAVFTKFYQEGTTTVEILDEIGTEASSVVRFNMRATSRAGHSYDVEYVLFAKTRDGLVYEVVELMDSQASAEQHQGNAVGVAPRL